VLAKVRVAERDSSDAAGRPSGAGASYQPRYTLTGTRETIMERKIGYYIGLGLVIGGAFGLLMGMMIDNMPLGMILGTGGGLTMGCGIGAYADRRTGE